jgi:hypothetical protein
LLNASVKEAGLFLVETFSQKAISTHFFFFLQNEKNEKSHKSEHRKQTISFCGMELSKYKTCV